MSTVGLIATVVAAAGWAGLDVFRKQLVGRMKPEPVLVWLVIGQSLLFVVWAARAQVGVLSPTAYLPLGAASVVLNVVASLAYLHAVRVSPLSIVIPLLSFVPVFTVAIANPLLGELPTLRQLVGVGVVVAGTLALGMGARPAARPRGYAGAATALFSEPGTVPMLITALCWSSTMVVDKLAMQHASAEAHGLILNLGCVAVLLAWMAARRRLADLRQIRGNAGLMGAAVVVGSVGLAAQLLAVGLLMAGVVEAIKRAIGIVAAVVAGRLFFGEPVTSPKIVAMILMSFGVALIVVPGA